MKKTLTSMIFVCVILSLSLNAQTKKSQSLPIDLLDLPAPPPVIPAKEKITENARPRGFYDEKNIPSDDAPIEDLLIYWSDKNTRFEENKYNLLPSKKSFERIIDAINENPELLTDFIKILPVEPDTIALVKKAYEKSLQVKTENNYRPDYLKLWLRKNSDMFIDELIQSAEAIKMSDRYLRNQEDLEALAKVSWDRAKPIVDRFEANPASSETYTLAKFVLYHHALKEKNTSDAESYRDQLKKLVEDKSLPDKTRDLAMDALVIGGDFEGRTEWYLSLFEDKTLVELQNKGFTGLTTLPRFMPPNQAEWMSSMIKILETGTPAQRLAAIRILIRSKVDKEILKAILPWLTDKTWAEESDDSECQIYVELLGSGDIPEAIPGLISIIANEKVPDNLPAVNAIASYDAPQAIPVLRTALRAATEFQAVFISALLKMKGFSTEEQLAGLEAYAAHLAKLESLGDAYEEEKNPISVETYLGSALSVSEPDDMLIMRALGRLKVLQKTNPPIAAKLFLILQKWNNRLIDAEMLDLVKSGKADMAIVLKLLARREMLRKRVPAELSAMRTIDGLPRGLSAIISEDRNEVFSILKRGDAETQISALAAARLIRMKIPVGDVAPFLSNPNRSLALAAERYLEAEDSVEARNLILAKYADETRILGARKMFVPVENKSFASLTEEMTQLFYSVNASNFTTPDESKLNKLENELRDEVKQNAELQAVFALLESNRDERAVIRLFKDKIVFTHYEDESRYYDRELSPKEYQAFYSFLLDSKLDTYQYAGDTCFNCANGGEFLMFGRGGGRRVFVQQNYSPKNPPFDKLIEFFKSFAEGDLKLHYNLAEKIKGLEVLLADKKLTARAVWKKGEDFRVLVEDDEKKSAIEAEIEELRKSENTPYIVDEAGNYTKSVERTIQSKFEHFSWRKIENDKVSGIETAQPDEIAYLGKSSSIKDYYGGKLNSEPDNFNRLAGGFEFDTEDEYGGDIVKIARSGSQTVVKNGSYQNPIVSPDGKWLIAAKRFENEENRKLVIINLQNGNETRINSIPPSDIIEPLAFVNSQYKFLVARSRLPYSKEKNNPSPKTPEYYLLDPNAGAAQITKGDFRPILQQSYRRLQPTTNPAEFWAAIFNEEKKHTEIGRYNEKTASFKSVLDLPDISLNSMNIWVDEAKSKVYFIYNGHLLAVPLIK